MTMGDVPYPSGDSRSSGGPWCSVSCCRWEMRSRSARSSAAPSAAQIGLSSGTRQRATTRANRVRQHLFTNDDRGNPQRRNGHRQPQRDERRRHDQRQSRRAEQLGCEREQEQGDRGRRRTRRIGGTYVSATDRYGRTAQYQGKAEREDTAGSSRAKGRTAPDRTSRSTDTVRVAIRIRRRCGRRRWPLWQSHGCGRETLWWSGPCSALPYGARPYTYWGRPYYAHGGVYYRPYTVHGVAFYGYIPPPIRVLSAAAGRRHHRHHSRRLAAVHEGTYYKKTTRAARRSIRSCRRPPALRFRGRRFRPIARRSR